MGMPQKVPEINKDRNQSGINPLMLINWQKGHGGKCYLLYL
jgi:hypothetical protein